MEDRVYPLKQPNGWKPKVPRWTLVLPDEITELAITYIGLQLPSDPSTTKASHNNAAQQIEQWISIDHQHNPKITERLEVVSGRDVPGTLIWICYWTSRAAASSSLDHLDLKCIAEASNKFGLWRESFSPAISRFETNYAGPDYQPGIAQIPDAQQIGHDRTGYWGAARDRIPASAYDLLDGDQASDPGDFSRGSEAGYFAGSNDRTIAHIRSGQWWEDCTEEESEAYETNLEPALHEGLEDIKQRPAESGDWGVRFLRNLPRGLPPSGHPAVIEPKRPRRETCGAGFFRTLADMEKWAKDCPSHHTIYNGAMKHKARFGREAKFRTWHEVSILQPGEVEFEYMNCAPGTGLLPFVQSLSSEGFEAEAAR